MCSLHITYGISHVAQDFISACDNYEKSSRNLEDCRTILEAVCRSKNNNAANY